MNNLNVAHKRLFLTNCFLRVHLESNYGLHWLQLNIEHIKFSTFHNIAHDFMIRNKNMTQVI